MGVSAGRYSGAAFAAFAMACSMPVANAKHADKKIEKIEIEGTTFRVVVTGNYAKAASKGSAWFAPVGARYFALARKAVEAVSGCKIIETNNFRATLYATLDCTPAPSD